MFMRSWRGPAFITENRYKLATLESTNHFIAAPRRPKAAHDFQILWQRSAMISHSVCWCHFPLLCLLFIVLCCSRLNYLRCKWSIRRSCSHCTLSNVNCHNLCNSTCSGASAVLWGALMATAPSVHCISTRKFKPCIVIYPFIQDVLAVGKFLRHKSVKSFSSIWPYTFCI